MDAPNQQIIDDLQAACQTLAHLKEQYKIDARTLHAMGLGWLQCRVEKWYKASEKHLKNFMDRLFFFETGPSYNVGPVTDADSITDLLKRAQGLVSAGLAQYRAFRLTAWNMSGAPDYTTDIYEHAIKALERQGYKIARELALLKTLGEPGYIGARLDDSK
jgi:bacterioferritin (cytochrome b1)